MTQQTLHDSCTLRTRSHQEYQISLSTSLLRHLSMYWGCQTLPFFCSLIFELRFYFEESFSLSLIKSWSSLAYTPTPRSYHLTEHNTNYHPASSFLFAFYWSSLSHLVKYYWMKNGYWSWRIFLYYYNHGQNALNENIMTWLLRHFVFN
jgi:hypothetical protein